MDRIFALYQGFDEESYWELREEEADPLIVRVKKDDVKQCGCLMTNKPLPYAWAPGRFFMLLGIGGDKKDWREVSHLVQHDPELGLEACPDWLRPQYEALIERSA